MKSAEQTMDAWKPSGVCAVCKDRPATQMWAEGGVLGATHGMYEFRCKRCCLKEQLAYARKMAEEIPRLERELRQEERGC